MSFAQAFLYFLQEACLSLVRSWKVSLLAVLTITVSLFLGGVFLLVSGNFEQLIAQWRDESKIVIYLAVDADESTRRDLLRELEEVPWVTGVQEVSADEARERFRAAFPSLADLLEGWSEETLPASLELRLGAEPQAETFASWLEALRSHAAVEMVDDDRDWLGQLDAVVMVIRGLGVLLGLVLLGTAIFTISSVIRLTAYLYRDEIAVMRMVGATEFFIRGPFYMEGFIQGTLGGILAIAALGGGYGVLLEKSSESLVAAVLAAEFLAWSDLLALVALGAGAGLIGAVTSLRKESLGQTTEYPDWTTQSG